MTDCAADVVVAVRVVVSDWLSLTRGESAVVLAIPFGVGAASQPHATFGGCAECLLVGAAMHAAGCVVNDVADLPVDRLDRRRAQRPMTSGRVGIAQALGLAGVLVGCFAFGVVLLHPAKAWLLVVVAAITLWGNAMQKRSRVPPLGWDAAWGVTVAAPALAFNRTTDTAQVTSAAVLAVALVLFDFSCTDIKDLSVDVEAGARTSARQFGLVPAFGGGAVPTRRFLVACHGFYAATVLLSLFSLAAMRAPVSAVLLSLAALSLGEAVMARRLSHSVITLSPRAVVPLLGPVTTYFVLCAVQSTVLRVAEVLAGTLAAAAALGRFGTLVRTGPPGDAAGAPAAEAVS